MGYGIDKMSTLQRGKGREYDGVMVIYRSDHAVTPDGLENPNVLS